MPLESSDLAFLWDMLQAAQELQQFTADRTYQEYLNDKLLQAGVERKIEIVGEAARNVSDSFKQAHPQIPWQGIIGQRHRLAHDYQRIDPERIWRVVVTHIPELIGLLSPLLPPPPPDPEPEP